MKLYIKWKIFKSFHYSYVNIFWKSYPQLSHWILIKKSSNLFIIYTSLIYESLEPHISDWNLISQNSPLNPRKKVNTTCATSNNFANKNDITLKETYEGNVLTRQSVFSCKKVFVIGSSMMFHWTSLSRSLHFGYQTNYWELVYCVQVHLFSHFSVTSHLDGVGKTS